jgi:hypothetical protein
MEECGKYRLKSPLLALIFHIQSLFKIFRYDMVNSHNRYSKKDTAESEKLEVLL